MKHHLYIYNAGGEYRVQPTIAELIKPNPNNIPPLWVRNATGEPVMLLFPANSVVQTVTQVGDAVYIDPYKKKSIDLILASTPPSFPLPVCVVRKDGTVVKAKAESDPIIIIDD